MRKMTSRAVAIATAGAMTLSGLMIAPVAAAPAQTKVPAAKETQASGMTEVSAQKRRHDHRNYRNDRAAVGAMLGIAGTIAGIAAAQKYRRDRDRYYGRHYDAPQSYGWYEPDPDLVGPPRGYYRDPYWPR